jgi:hypothetical protein
MKSIDALRRRLANLLPGQQEEINQTRHNAKLLEIAVEALEFRSEALSSTGFELGDKIGREYARQKSALEGKTRQRQATDELLMRHLETAYSAFLLHKGVQKKSSPGREARRLAWQSTHENCEKIAGRPMKLESLKKRLRPYLTGSILGRNGRS